MVEVFQRVLRDGNLFSAESQANRVLTDSVLLLGTATDGPVDVPVPVSRIVEMENLYGRQTDAAGLPNGMSLVRGMKELYAAGCTDIRLFRVGGVYANATIVGQPVTRNQSMHVDEVIGEASGNIETVFNLPVASGGTLDPASVQLKVDGQILEFGWTVDAVANTLTLEAGWARSGAEIYISYQYSVVTSTPQVTGEILVKQDATTYYLAHGPIVFGTLQIFIDGVEQPATSFDGTTIYWVLDEDANKVVFTSAPAGVVTANYQYKVLQTENAFTTGTAQGQTQMFNLSQSPNIATFNAYANGVLLPKTAYMVNAAERKFFLYPGYAPLLADIRVVYDYSAAISFTPELVLRGYYPGQVYNQVTYDLSYNENSIGTLSFTKPAGKQGQSFSVTINEYPNLGKLCEAVNNDPRNTFVRLSTNAADFAPAILQAASGSLSGGADGPKPSDADYKQQMYDLLEKAYELLTDYEVDFVVPLDVYADDPVSEDKNFAYQLAKFCAVSSMANSETIGIIGVKPIADTSLSTIKAKSDALAAEGNNQYFLKDSAGNFMYDEDGHKIDIGRFICVVAGPDLVFQNEALGTYVTSGATAVAGLVSGLPPHYGVNQQLLRGPVGMRFGYSSAQIDKLVSGRYIVFRTRIGASGITVVDGVTAAAPDSDYGRLTTMRIVAAAVSVVRKAAQPFIGLPNDVPHRNALATAIRAGLDRMYEQGAFEEPAQFQLFSSQRDKALGNAIVDLTLVPVFELRQVKTTVTLRASIQ